ncbi:hypothetical protein Tco_1289619 [Tanacetum coccineum]
METHKPLLKDVDGEDVDEHMYRSMIDSLMYLTSSRPDIMFRYLKGQPKLGLWYPKDLPFDLVAYTNSDYAGASLDKKSTTGGCQFLGCRLISWQCKKQTVVANSTTEAEYVPASSCCGQTKHIKIRHHFIRDSNEKKLIQMIKIHTDKNVADLITKAFDLKVNAVRHNLLLLANVNAVEVNPTIYTSCIKQFWATAKVKTINGEVQLHALVDRKKVIITESTIRRDLQLEDAEGFLDKQVGDTSTHDEIFVIPSHTKKLSGKDCLKLNDLMEICTKLQQRVLDLKNTKIAQTQEISSLKLRVKRLEKKGGSRTHKLKRLFKVGRSAQVVSSKDEEQSEKVVKEVVSTTEVSAAATITTEEITLAQALAELRSAKPKVVVQEPVQSTTTTTPSTIPKAKSITFRDLGESTTRTTLTPIPSNIKDKGKAKMIEPKKPLKKKEQIRLDEELAFKLQAEEEEQARLAREKVEKVEEANSSWDNVKAMIEDDRVNMFVDMDTELVKESLKKAEAEMAQESSSKRGGEELEQEVAKK